MTTEIKRELSLDLCRNPAWPIFSGRQSAGPPSVTLAAYSVIWRGPRDEPGVAVSQSAQALQDQLGRAMQRLGLSMQVLVLNNAMQTTSATVLYRKIWKATSLPMLSDQITLGKESQFGCGHGVRFAAMATLQISNVHWALSAMDTQEIAIPILGRKLLPLEPETTETLVRAAFPPDGCGPGASFDWLGFVAQVQLLGGIVMRRIRDLARAEAGADFFGAETEIDRFWKALEDVDRPS